MFRCFVSIFTLLIFLTGIAIASATSELSEAAKAGKIVFLFVTDFTSLDDETPEKVIQDAMNQIKNTTMVKVDRDDESNANLISMYGLEHIPVPVILVINPDGVVVGSVNGNDAKINSLTKLIPSPKKTLTIKAVQNGYPVYVIGYRNNMPETDKVFSECESATKKLDGKATVVKVDMDDKEETDFLNLLRVDLDSDEPVTVVINCNGQIAETNSGLVSTDELIQAAQKVITSSQPANVPGSGACCSKSSRKH
jgi:hypothetical protein